MVLQGSLVPIRTSSALREAAGKNLEKTRVLGGVQFPILQVSPDPLSHVGVMVAPRFMITLNIGRWLSDLGNQRSFEMLFRVLYSIVHHILEHPPPVCVDLPRLPPASLGPSPNFPSYVE